MTYPTLSPDTGPASRLMSAAPTRQSPAPMGADRASSLPRGPGVWLELARYFIASAAALGVDVGLFAGCMRLGLAYPLAASIGFIAGAVVAYLASVRWVFDARCVRNAGLEFGLFVAIGIAGLLLTEGLLWLLVGAWQWPAVLSKLGAAGFVFVFNFAVRKTMLFRPAAR